MTSTRRILTAGDFSTLSQLSEEWRSSEKWFAPTARKMLEDALVVFPSDLPRDVASLGSRVTYAERGTQSRTAELTALVLFDRDYLPIRMPLGLALLGRREGDEFEVRLENGRLQHIKLEKVIEQPERTWPGRFEADASDVSGRAIEAGTEEGA